MTTAVQTRDRAKPALPLLVFAGLGALLFWAYWPIFLDLLERWGDDPQYSHGYLVPLFALVMLYLRRRQLAEVPLGLHAWGLLWLALGGVLRLAGAYVYFD